VAESNVWDDSGVHGRLGFDVAGVEGIEARSIWRLECGSPYSMLGSPCIAVSDKVEWGVS
jgi:hypothetical protein